MVTILAVLVLLALARLVYLEVLARRSQARFRALAQSSDNAVVLIDSRGAVLFWSKGMERIFSYSEAEAKGQPFTMVMLQGSELRLIGGAVELVGLTKNGQEIPVELSLAAWRAGGEWFYTGVIHDLTERRRKEDRVSNAVHELRTPLTTAKGFIELIAGGDAGPVTDTQREFLEIAARSTDRLGVLIDDLVGRSGRGS